MRLLVVLSIALSASTRTGFAQVPSGPRPGAQAAETPDDVGVLAKEAERDFAKGNYVSAAQKYERLASLQPNSANVLNNLGIAYHMAGRARDAVRVLQKALRLNPDLLSANLFLGIEYIQLNQPEQAISPLEMVLRRDGNQRDALLALASAHFALKRFDLAAKVYLREVKIRPNDPDAWYAMGLCFELVAENTTRHLSEVAAESSYYKKLQGEYLVEMDVGVDAEEAFRRAIASAIAGEDEGLHADMGFARLRLGAYAEASDEFQTELQLHPGNLEAKLGLAAGAMERQEWSNAVRYLCEVHAADQGFFQTHLDFLITLLREPTASQALETLGPGPATAGCPTAIDQLRTEMTSAQSMIGLDAAFATPATGKPLVRPADPQAVAAARRASEAGHYGECVRILQLLQLHEASDVLLFGRCNSLTGRFLAALEAAQGVTASKPNDPQALYWQGEAARKLAQAALQRAVTLNPDSWQGHVLLGDLYRQRKKWDLATSHYETAASLKPDSPGPLLGLATIHWQLGRNPQAEEALKKALQMAPENAVANFMLGDVLVRQRRFEQAIPYLKKHLAHGPGYLAAHGDLGKAFAALGIDKDAISELLIALPSDESGELHYQLYVLYKKQGQPELARQALAESERLRSQEHETKRRRLERAVSASEDSKPSQP